MYGKKIIVNKYIKYKNYKIKLKHYIELTYVLTHDRDKVVLFLPGRGGTLAELEEPIGSGIRILGYELENVCLCFGGNSGPCSLKT